MKKLQTNLTIVGAVISALVGTQAMAANPASAVATVTTIADVSISEEEVMDFGSDIVPLAGTICEMELTTTYNDAAANGNSSTLTSDWDWVTGNECNVGFTPQGGVFSISGSADQSVTVTYTGDTDTSVATFIPDILYMGVPFGSAAQTGLADGGAGTVLTDLARVNLGIATGITPVTLDSGGDGSLFIGGELTIVSMGAGLDDTLTYTLDVIY